MRISLEPAPRRLPGPWWMPPLVAAWCVWAAFVHALNAAGHSTLLACNLRRVTGVPCPTCGSTRAAFALARGEPLAAVAWNPLVAAGVAVLTAILVLRILLGRRLILETTAAGRRRAWAAFGVLLLLNWAWVLIRHT